MTEFISLELAISKEGLKINGVLYKANIEFDNNEIKICNERMFALFDGKEFVEESFGDKVVENVKGNVEIDNLKFGYDPKKEVKPEKKVETKKVQPKNKKPNVFVRIGRKLKEVFSELKKVSWPSFDKIVKQTAVVLGVVLMFMIVLRVKM